MLDTGQNVLIVIVGVACSLFFMAGVNSYWPAEQRRAHNDLIGWQLSVLGTTYAVIIGFMLFIMFFDVQDLPFVPGKHAALRFPKSGELGPK